MPSLKICDGILSNILEVKIKIIWKLLMHRKNLKFTMISCSFKYKPRLESGWASEPNPVIETMQWGRGREDEDVEWTFSPCYLQHNSTGKRHKVLNITQVCHFNHSYYCLIMTIKSCMLSADLFHEPQKNEKKNL